MFFLLSVCPQWLPLVISLYARAKRFQSVSVRTSCVTVSTRPPGRPGRCQPASQTKRVKRLCLGSKESRETSCVNNRDTHGQLSHVTLGFPPVTYSRTRAKTSPWITDNLVELSLPRHAPQVCRHILLCVRVLRVEGLTRVKRVQLVHRRRRKKGRVICYRFADGFCLARRPYLVK